MRPEQSNPTMPHTAGGQRQSLTRTFADETCLLVDVLHLEGAIRQVSLPASCGGLSNNAWREATVTDSSA